MGPSSTRYASSIADALTIAGKLDDAKPSAKQPLAGVPILVKDNIATGDKQPTTAGSLALEGARARGDATVVKLLRDAGAVILGKANLTEFANILAIDMPSGYSLAGRPGEEPLRADADGRSRHPGRVPGRLELGISGRSGGRSVRGLDRHRDLGLAAVPRQPEWPRHRQADRRTDQPCRHPADLAQPGHRRADDAYRARRGDAPERVGGQGPARPGDATAAAAERLHRRPRARCDEGRAHRRAERSRRPAERLLLRQAATQVGQGDGRRDQGAGGSGRRRRARQHADGLAGLPDRARPWLCSTAIR